MIHFPCGLTSAIRRVALAWDEAVGFERVKQRHGDAGVDALYGLSEVTLAHPATVVQKPENMVMAGLEVVGIEGVSQAADRLLAEHGQQQAPNSGPVSEIADAASAARVGRSQRLDRLPR